jgi:hypothetical protein
MDERKVRTPTEIFEEVLDAWDNDVKAHPIDEEEVSFRDAPPKAQIIDHMEALKAILAQAGRFRGGELAGDD